MVKILTVVSSQGRVSFGLNKYEYDFLEIFRYMKFANRREVKLAILSLNYLRDIRKISKALRLNTLLKPVTKDKLKPLIFPEIKE